MKVGIIGSCVTRDAFEFPMREEVSLQAYFARSSLASACSDRIFPGVDPSAISSSFQRRMVEADLTKAFLPYIGTAAYDLLVYDPIDERFDLLCADGALATRSDEFNRALFEPGSAKVIPSASPEFFELWCRGWSRLLKALDSRGKRGALRINQVYWAIAAEEGLSLESVVTREQVDTANKFLDRLYARMREDLPEEQFYTYPPSLLLAARDHKWGVGPFHFVPEFYEAFVGHIDRELARVAKIGAPRVITSRQRWESDDVDLTLGQDAVPCEDRVFNFKGRHIVHSVHGRPASRRLMIMFSGIDATPGTTRMSYFGLGKSLDATVVHIKDGFGTHGSYLLSVAGDEQVRNAVLALIRELQAECGVDNDRTFLVGTAKGGTSALAYGLMLGGGHVIAGEPQVRLGQFLYGDATGGDDVAEWQRAVAYAMLGRVDPDDRARLDDIVTGVARRYASRFRGSIEVMVGNTGCFENHVTPLLEVLVENGRGDCVSVTRYGFPEHGGVVPPFVARLRELLGRANLELPR